MPLGETIDLDVINQIEARQELFSTNNRNEDQLRYLNSRNAWVRVISFVNKGGEAELSENFVLSGVASSHIRDEGFKQYSGVDFTLGSDSNSFYKTTEVFGTRPRPGITSFNIKSKNSGGTIQVAEIGFVVWNEDDLDTIEQLYLRLGFEVMVEWGHTVYIDNNGDLQEYVDKDYNTFFNNTVYERTVKRHISGSRSDTDYNADGFLGYITNFSWNFRQDGGYECSIKVISTGAVIESLLGSVGSSEKSKLPIEDDFFSEFHTLYRLLAPSNITSPERTVTNFGSGGIPIYTTFAPNTTPTKVTFDTPVLVYEDELILRPLAEVSTGINLFNELKKEFGDEVNRELGAVLTVRSPEFEPATVGITRDETTEFTSVFLPLRYCLALINIIIKRQNQQSAVSFDLQSDEKFLLSKNLVVTKPLKTLLLLGRIIVTNTRERNLYYEDAYEIARQIKYSSAPLDPDHILNIFVNLEVFVRNIDSLSESNPDDSQISLFTLLTNVLEEINESVSYGIDLGIAFDEDKGKFKIIDRGNLPGGNNSNVPREIKISGTSTTVSSLSLTSKVTNKLGNQISIAAQTNPGSYPASVIKYREWNDDLTTRLKRVNREGNTGVSLEGTVPMTKDQRLGYVQKLYHAYNELNNRGVYDSAKWKSAAHFSQTFTQEGIDYDPNIPKGLIPIELSFTMDGIAGLKVLQTFKIPNDLLPKKYKNDLVGFIINGIEHTIENNRWFTQVRAQMYLFRDPDRIYPDNAGSFTLAAARFKESPGSDGAPELELDDAPINELPVTLTEEKPVT